MQKINNTTRGWGGDNCNHIVLCTNINYRSHQSSAELLNIYNYLMLQFHAIKLVYPIGKDIQYSIWITKVGNLRPNMMPITSKFHLPPTPTLQKKKKNYGYIGKSLCQMTFEKENLKIRPGIFSASKSGNSSSFNPPTLFLAKINRSS